LRPPREAEEACHTAIEIPTLSAATKPLSAIATTTWEKPFMSRVQAGRGVDAQGARHLRNQFGRENLPPMVHMNLGVDELYQRHEPKPRRRCFEAFRGAQAFEASSPRQMRTAANWLMKMYERQGRDEPAAKFRRDLDVEALSAVRRRAPGGDRSVIATRSRSTQMSILWPWRRARGDRRRRAHRRLDVAWRTFERRRRSF